MKSNLLIRMITKGLFYFKYLHILFLVTMKHMDTLIEKDIFSQISRFEILQCYSKKYKTRNVKGLWRIKYLYLTYYN